MEKVSNYRIVVLASVVRGRRTWSILEDYTFGKMIVSKRVFCRMKKRDSIREHMSMEAFKIVS